MKPAIILVIALCVGPPPSAASVAAEAAAPHEASVAAEAAAPHSDAEIAKGFENLKLMYSIAQVIDTWQALGRTVQPSPMNDPWGTPYRVESARTYRIIGAGSDRKFDEASWTPAQQFSGLEGDVVLDNGKLVRSNRNWLVAQMTGEGASVKELAALRNAELVFMTMRSPGMQQLTGVRLSSMAMEMLGERVEKERKENGGLARLAPPADALDTLLFSTTYDASNARLARDAWGTFFKIVVDGERYRVISAGSNRQIDPEADVSDDIIFENGKFTRRPDEKELLKESAMTVSPIAQPPDPSLAGAGRWQTVGSPVKAPVVVARVEPEYPEDYRRARISGIVILQMAISETGAVEDVRVLKSLAPEIDMSAVKAARRWTFQPGTRDGAPVPVLFNLTVNFKLQ